MSTNLTVRDFLLHNLKNEYIKRAGIIVGLTPHIEKMHNDFLISNLERSRFMKLTNDIIRILNFIYNTRINLIKDNKDAKNDNDIEYCEMDDESFKMKKLQPVKNMDKKLSEFINISENITNSLNMISNMAHSLYKNELKHICPDDFQDLDNKIQELLCLIGLKSIKKIISACTKSPLDYIINDFDDKVLLFDILENTFVPVSVHVNHTKIQSKAQKIKLTKIDEIPEKYEILLDNYYKLELSINVLSDEIKLMMFGYFESDCVNSIIRVSQICNKYVNDKKKEFLDFCDFPNAKVTPKVNSKIITKINNIPINFRKAYIKNLSLGDLLAYDKNIFVNAMYDDYVLYQKYLTINNFKSLFAEFIQADLITKFKIIKFLLLNSNTGDAGLLFSLMKESKSGSMVISDIFYKNLNFSLQTKLHKTNVAIKNEVEKLNNINIDDVDLKRQIMMNKNMPSKVKRCALEKLNEMKAGNSEYYKQLLYVKTLIDYPWRGENDGDVFSLHKNDIRKCEEIMRHIQGKLNNKVYGHKECKETIVEMVGKWFSNPKSLGKAIGLLGPPGVGKTLIAKELGDALDIPCVKINLGGMSDGAILSGHSITYSGAVPGMMVKKMIEAGKPRCIVVCDELDKTSFHHGRNEIFDILIHLIDSTTSEFNDNFFQDIAFHKEKVIFVFLFNDKSKIDPILLDRMEIIEVGAYSTEDKISIVNDFLLKKIKEDIGLTSMNITISTENIVYLIEYFTHEAGVRGIERKIDKILLKLNKDRIFRAGPFEGKNAGITKIELTKELIDKYIVKPNILITKVHPVSEIGIFNALYCTSVDGGILPVLMYKRQEYNGSKFSLKLTGQQGKVMRESVEFSFTLATNLVKTKYLETFLKNYPYGLHIHLSGGKKDGPSAGGVFASCFISVLLHKRIKNTVSLTGEIDRDGNITAIGGLNFKLPGAKKAGVKFVMVSEENRKDLEKVIETQKTLFDDNFKYTIVSNIREVLDLALIEDGVNITEKDMTYEKVFDHTKYLKNDDEKKIVLNTNKKMAKSTESSKNTETSSKTTITTDTEKSGSNESSSSDMSK